MAELETIEIGEHERANGLFEWLQGFGEQAPSMFSIDATNRLGALGVTKDQLDAFRDAILKSQGKHKIPLQLYFSGFPVVVLDEILGKGCEDVIGESIKVLESSNPGLFQEYVPLPPMPIEPELGGVALKATSTESEVPTARPEGSSDDRIRLGIVGQRLAAGFLGHEIKEIGGFELELLCHDLVVASGAVVRRRGGAEAHTTAEERLKNIMVYGCSSAAQLEGTSAANLSQWVNTQVRRSMHGGTELGTAPNTPSLTSRLIGTRALNTAAQRGSSDDDGFGDNSPSDDKDKGAKDDVEDNGIVRLSKPSTIDKDAADAVLGGPAASTDLVNVYLKEIGKTPLLTAEDEVKFAKIIEAGLYAQRILDSAEESELAERRITVKELEQIAQEGDEAKKLMVQANLRLVVSIAKKIPYKQKGLDFLDAISEGNTGLIRAIEKFDYTKGYKISTYATWWIRQAIARGIADTGRLIRLPVHKGDELSSLDRTKRDFMNHNYREPTPEELAEITGKPLEAIVELIELAKQVTSLDAPVSNNGDPSEATLGDLLAQESDGVDERIDASMKNAEIAGLFGLMDKLPDREAKVLRLRYGIDSGKPMKLAEIGQALGGLTTERARQIEFSAKKHLRALAATLNKR